MKINLIKSNKEVPNGFIFDKEYQAYRISSSTKPIAKVLLNSEEYASYRMKDHDIESQVSAKVKEVESRDTRQLEIHCSFENKDLVSNVTKAVVTVNEEQTEPLPYGVYRICTVEYSTMYKAFPLNEKKNKVSYIDIMTPIKEFFNNKDPNRPRLGILLYGKAGNGKSMSIREVCDLPDTYVFYVAPKIELSSLLDAREVLKDKNVVFVFEEITATLDDRSLQEYLGFLDGEYSWNNCVTIATTNNPEELPSNLVDRPGRLELFYEFKSPKRNEIEDLAKLFNYTGDISFLSGKDLSWDYCSFLLNKAVKDNSDLKTIHEAETEKRRKLSETFKGTMGL